MYYAIGKFNVLKPNLTVIKDLIAIVHGATCHFNISTLNHLIKICRLTLKYRSQNKLLQFSIYCSQKSISYLVHTLAVSGCHLCKHYTRETIKKQVTLDASPCGSPVR